MKHLLRLAALLGLLILTGCPKPECVKIVHLSFDGSLFDSSVNNFSVSATDTVKYAKDRFAHRNGAIHLNGGAALTIPSSPKLDFQGNSEYSISVWVRTRDTSTASLVAKGQDAPVPGYSLQLRNGRPAAIFTGSLAPIELIATESVSDNIWHLLTLSVAPDSIKLYTDTTLVASGSGAQLAPQKNKKGPLFIGNSSNGINPYRGFLDNLIIRPCETDQDDVDDTYSDSAFSPVITLADLPPGVLNPFPGLMDVEWKGSIGYACGAGGKLIKTIDGGANWSPLTSPYIGPSSTLLSVSFFDPLKGVVLDLNGTLHVTENGGGIWTQVIPALGGLANQRAMIWSAEYVESSVILLCGSAVWLSGGKGFLAKTDPANGLNTQFIQTGVIGEQRIISVVKNTETQLWTFGTNGEAWRYTLPLSLSPVGPQTGPLPSSAPIGTDVSINGLDVKCAHIISVAPGEFVGLVGGPGGEIWRYNESSVGLHQWNFEPSNFDARHWVIWIRAENGSARAISSGEDATGLGSSLATVRSGSWQQEGIWSWPSSHPQGVVAYQKGTSVFLVKEDPSQFLNVGQPGILIP